MRTRLLPLLAVLASAPASGFDYLEHSFITDQACLQAQRELGRLLEEAAEEGLAARYLALSLTCPESWDRPYCAGGYKQLEGGLNRLQAPPAQSHDHSITLGDFSALPDHLSEFGAVRGLARAARDGLTTRTLRWLARTGDAGGVISDVAEDACEARGPLHWEVLYREPDRVGPSVELPASPLLRAPAQKVVSDPAGAYSFDNPQYLDLVLHNHGHFGREAYRNWTGFHVTARDLADAACEQVLPPDRALFKALARGLAPFDQVGWRGAADDAVVEQGCRVVAERVRLRILDWAQRAPPERVAPVRAQVARLSGPGSVERDALARSLVTPLLALVFEGAGLHYLQDSLSGGHVRVQRLAYDLETSRYQHDADSVHGVVARVTTAESSEEVVLFGDGYLLGTPLLASRCEGEESGWSPLQVTHCLLQRQRAVILRASTASLLRWAQGPGNAFSRRHLMVVAPGDPRPPEGVEIPRGELPTPPPPFSYQSFLFSTSADVLGGPPQLGVRAVFLHELDSRANWMTSYHFGLLARLGRGPQSQLSGEFSYMFHWRWAARFLLNGGPFAFVGLGDFDRGASPFLGVGPNLGFSVLPEGWIRLPLEISLSYRLPVRLLDGRVPLRETRPRVDAHWIELSLGLAFL
jgi:hypothetical protein